MSSEVSLNAANFETEVLKSPIPVLVDFWAEWCMPCKMIGPIVDQLATQYQGRIKVAKVNVDQESDLAGSHNIVYKDGKVVRQKIGALPKHEIENLFKDLI